MSIIPGRGLAILLLLLATSCASPPRADESAAPSDRSDSADEHGTPSRADAMRPAMFNGLTGEPMTFDQVVSIMADADVVVLGELHGHPVGLDLAADFFGALLTASPGVALSMEFFERDDQVALDDYLAGVTDRDGFKEAAGRTGGNYPAAHERMVEAAKAYGRPVFAANAPRRYVRLARTEGFDRLRELTPEQRRLFVVPDRLPTGRYRDRFWEVMGAMGGDHGGEAEGESESADDNVADHQPDHSTSDDPIAAAFRSQAMWDATMADSIRRAVQTGAEPVFHVVGEFHVAYGGGVPALLEEQRPNWFVWTVSVVDEASDRLREEDRGRADCVVYVGPFPESR